VYCVTTQLSVDLGLRSYPIVVGTGLLNDLSRFAPFIAGRQVCIVTNETIAPLYLDALKKTLEQYQVDACVLPDGEEHKTLETYARVMDHLMSHRHNRSTTLIALGGGVVGDITGFAAATYQRGVALIQVPTTLLALVDSSVGGKTAVNHPHGKNMIGAFYQPRLVLADLDTLRSLPEREYLAGIAEIVKYGVIRDAKFFGWLETNVAALQARDAAALDHAVITSCAIKAAVVAGDEREEGVRAILNFGHTFGHAIETLTRYEYLHGESVAIGMVMAADLSVRIGLLNRADGRRIKALIAAFGLPVVPPGNVTAAAMRASMGMDKKVVDGRLRLVLTRALGDALVTDQFDTTAFDATLTAHGRLCED
jgi:3-dehydroquinate synthase